MVAKRKSDLSDLDKWAKKAAIKYGYTDDEEEGKYGEEEEEDEYIESEDEEFDKATVKQIVKQR